MTAAAPPRRRPRALPLIGALLGSLAVLLLAGGGIALAALLQRPFPWQFGLPAVSLHVGAALAALALGAIQLVGRKGDFRHRSLGYAWCAVMLALALSSFAIQLDPSGGVTVAHRISSAFSITTLILLPVVVYSGRRGARRLHRNALLALFALLFLAGALSFLPHRTFGLLTWALLG